MKLLTFNCQKDYTSRVLGFIVETLRSGTYDFILFQELTSNVYEKIIPGISNYKFLRAMNMSTGSWSDLAIAYRDTFELADSKFFDFTIVAKEQISRPSYGLLIGAFKSSRGMQSVGTLHMNPGLNPGLRKKEGRFVKKCLLDYMQVSGSPLVFGGDFNSGLPWENKRNERIFLPEFVNCASSSGPTCDSRYVEPTNFLNKLARALAVIGIHFRMKVDHFYVDRATLKQSSITCAVLPNIVSDHRPLEIVM